jgi:hypothetical protein
MIKSKISQNPQKMFFFLRGQKFIVQEQFQNYLNTLGSYYQPI